MNDRELLERAAKAAGYGPIGVSIGGYVAVVDGDCMMWNPLSNDGDALRLAVKLRLEIAIHETYSGVINGNLVGGHVQHDGDPYAATRRAIVRAAAAMVQTRDL